MCAYNRRCNTRAKGHFHAQVTCLAPPTHGSNFFYSPFSSLSPLLLSLSIYLSIYLFFYLSLPVHSRCLEKGYWREDEKVFLWRNTYLRASIFSTCTWNTRGARSLNRETSRGRFLGQPRPKNERGEVLSFIHESWGPRRRVSLRVLRIENERVRFTFRISKAAFRLPRFFFLFFFIFFSLSNEVPRGTDEDGNFGKRAVDRRERRATFYFYHLFTSPGLLHVFVGFGLLFSSEADRCLKVVKNMVKLGYKFPEEDGILLAVPR